MATFFTPDTNILVRSWTQGKSGCEMNHWETIRKKCEAGELTLLVTEVVLLEAENQWQQLLDDIDTKLAAVETSLNNMFANKPHDWSEIKDVGQLVVDQVVRARATKKQTAKENHDTIDSILRAPYAKFLPYSPEVHFRMKKRMLAGRFPRIKERYSEADCAIIESICQYFEQNAGEHSLIFCSENHSDFGTKVDSRFYLHPILKEGLPQTELFLNLNSVVEALEANHPQEKVSTTEVVAAAERDREKQIFTKASEISNAKMPGMKVNLSPCGIHILSMLKNSSTDNQHYHAESLVRNSVLASRFTIAQYDDSVMYLQSVFFVKRVHLHSANGRKISCLKITKYGMDWLHVYYTSLIS